MTPTPPTQDTIPANSRANSTSDWSPVAADLLAIAGIATTGSAPRLTFRCPSPQLHSNGDARPSASIDLTKGAWRCHACGSKGGLKALAQTLNVDWHTLLARHRRAVHAVPAAQHAVVAQWLRVTRALPESEIAVLYATDTKRGAAVGFDFGGYKKFRYIDKKGFWRSPSGTPTTLYGLQRFDPSLDWVVIAEGELDAHALSAVGYSNTVSVPDGAGSSITPELLAPLSAVQHVFIATDADAAGDTLAERIAAVAGRSRCKRVTFALNGTTYKDANDALIASWTRGTFECAFAAAVRFPTPPNSADAANSHSEPKADGDELKDRSPPKNSVSPESTSTTPPAPPPAQPPTATTPEIHCTDAGNARWLVGRHGKNIRYVSAIGWLLWEATHWQRDASSRIVELAKETLFAMLLWARSLQDEGLKKRWGAHAIASESRKSIEAMVKLAQSEPAAALDAGRLDADHWLLNTPSGTLDLKTGTARSHDQADHITKVTGAAYDPKAQCPTWDAFLDVAMGGKKTLVAFLKRAVGYSATASTKEQVLFLLYGLGANGKSVFLETIRFVLGKYALQADFTAFLEKRSEGPRNDLARLQGARLVTAVEMEAGRSFAEAVVKQATGGDTVSARFLYKEFFEFTPTFKLWLATNHKPIVKGSDYAIWRRIRLIPFEVTIPPEKQDRDLTAKLRAEGPGILRWIVEGCLEWQRTGLEEAPEVSAATNAYRDEMDTLADFFAEHCIFGPNRRASAKELYTEYQVWAEQLGDYKLSMRTFGMRLTERGLRRLKSHGITMWLGIGLRGPDDNDGGRGSASPSPEPERRADSNDVISARPTPADHPLAEPTPARGEDGEDGGSAAQTVHTRARGGVPLETSPSSPSSPRPAPASPLGSAGVGQSVTSAGSYAPTPPYTLVASGADLAAVANAVALAGVVALDTETTGLDPLRDRPRLLQLGLPDGQAFVVDLFRVGGLGPLADALRNVRVVAHNAQFDLGFLRQHYDIAPAAVWCTMTAAKLAAGGIDLHAKGTWDLASLCRRHLGVELPKDERLSDWSSDLTTAQLDYAARDVGVLAQLSGNLHQAVSAAGLSRVADLEFAVLPAVVDMELAGVRIDSSSWSALLTARTAASDDARKAAASALRVENVDSPKQVLSALQRLGIGVSRTGADVLAPYAGRPEVRALIDYRQAIGFVRGIGPSIAAALQRHGDGRVHAQLAPMAAPTGRFGCSDPNLLALPKDREIRQAVVPADGHVFVKADYAAIELRVLAELTRDATLVDLFRNGGDPHRRTAAALLSKAEGLVTADERQKAKAVNFGFAFGMGPSRFVSYARADYGVEIAELDANRFKASYLRTYPGVDRWQRQTRATMPTEVRTIAGRLRRFTDRTKGFCERLNTPVQGTAADGMKYALVLLHRRLPTTGGRIILCVHDEVLIEAPVGAATEVKAVVDAAMIEGMAAVLHHVPVVVESDIRPTWAGAERPS